MCSGAPLCFPPQNNFWLDCEVCGLLAWEYEAEGGGFIAGVYAVSKDVTARAISSEGSWEV